METQKPTISFDVFSQLDLRVGRITAAEVVEGADRLLRIEVDIGEEKRQLVAGLRHAGVVSATQAGIRHAGVVSATQAGIRDRYAPKELLGKQVVVVANLEPKVLKGIESQGMLLCADGTDGPVLLTPEREVPAGAAVR